MTPPFDPYHLTPSASLNRVRIVDLPGLDIDPEVSGKTGYELLSAQFLTGQIRQYVEQLKLPPELLSGDERRIPVLFNQCLVSGDASVRAAADAIARRLGRNLAYLLLTLKRGDPANRAARPDWDDTYWAHWTNVRRVWLGGGLVSGNLGRQIGVHIAGVFAGAGMPPYALAFDRHGAALPMVGAARYVPPGPDAALVLDFGGSFVKRACAGYEAGAFTQLRLLPHLRAVRLEDEHRNADPPDQARGLLAFMASAIADTWEQVCAAGVSLARTIPVSLASYIAEGQPADRQGGAYTALRLITDNAQRSLSEAVSARLGVGVQVLLLHDGTAAASAKTGEQNAAVILLGTAMGVGFPPPGEGLCPIAPEVRISDFTPDSV